MAVKNSSPLRYPGGKSCLSNFLSELAHANNLQNGIYLELFAGGAGAALNLLYNGVYNTIHINDYDYHIYAMWYSILNHSEEFIEMIMDVDVSIEEWHNQQSIYKMGRDANIISLGFSTFFLNRTNRSGIIFKAGPIGGLKQEGNYKINVRFNKESLVSRIKKIASYRDQIILTNLDAVDIITNIRDYYPNVENLFIYLDPPYYKKGKLLYLNNYNHQNHESLARAVEDSLQDIKWLISYDNVDEIKIIYYNFRMSTFDLNYTLQSKKFGSELLVFSNDLILRETITVNSRVNDLILF